MTGVTIQQFNQYFTDSYPSLVSLSKKIDNGVRCNTISHNSYKDSLHDTYLKISSRINSKGFSGNISGYTCIVLRNNIIDSHKRNKNREDLAHHTELIEYLLADKAEEIQSTQDYQQQIRELSRIIFQYLSRIYDEKELFIFRVYFTTKGSTYKNIAAITGYSKSFVGEIVKQIKIDLRSPEFREYLKNKQ